MKLISTIAILFVPHATARLFPWENTRAEYNSPTTKRGKRQYEKKKAEFLETQTPALLCCEQKGGVHIAYQSLGITDSVNAICEYKGERYREDFFLNTYCGGTAEPIKIEYPTCAFRKGTEGLEEMCLDCCRKAHKKYEDRKCKNSLLCFDNNDEAFLQCEQRCVGTCDNHCNDQKEVCMEACSEQTSGLRGCEQQCSRDYNSCNETCEVSKQEGRAQFLLPNHGF